LKGSCNPFEVYRFNIGGNKLVHVCNLNTNSGFPGGMVDGGTRYVYYRGCYPDKPYSYYVNRDLYKITDADRAYRKYMIQKAFAKANEAKFNATVQLAELGETLEYLHGIGSTLVKIFFKTKKGTVSRFSDVIERVKNPQDTWLEWRYAIMPMILSMQDLLEALALKGTPSTVCTYKKVVNKQIIDDPYTWAWGTLHYIWDGVTTTKYGVGLDVQFQNDVAPWGTGAYDTVLAAWEKTKLSFVVDWFFDIGQWLESFRDTNLKLGNKYATIAKETKWKVYVDRGKSNVKSFVSVPDEKDPFIVSAFHMDRIVMSDVIPPTTPMLTPGVLSLYRKLDGLSLIIGLLKGLKRR